MLKSQTADKNDSENDDIDGEGSKSCMDNWMEKCSYQNLIFMENSWISNIWKSIDIISCIISSYIYAYMAAFGESSLSESAYILYILFEAVFVISIIKNFTTEYKSDGMSKPIRDIKKIAIRYLNTGFIIDLLMVIPFAYIFGGEAVRNAKLCYFIKCYRLVRGFKIFNVSDIISKIQLKSMESMQERIKKNPNLGEDQTIDHNSIEEILLLGYFLKTMKLVIMIFNISFFVGIFFFVFCDIQSQVYASQ